jgi:hypothetical protein
LQQEPDACSVKKFWSLHKDGVPASVIFLPGPKLSDPGLSWSPANLKNLQVMGRRLDAVGKLTPAGICVNYPGVSIEPLKTPFETVLPFEVGGTQFFLKRILRGGSPSWEGLNLIDRRGLALIILDIDGLDRPFVEIDVGLGVLVDGYSTSAREDGYLKVKYLRLCSFVQKGSFSDHHPNVPWTNDEIEEKLLEPVKAVDLGLDMSWCIA